MKIPTPLDLMRRSQALASIDAILCPQWDLRYFSFNMNWSANEQMASMRDGEGSDYFILFAPFGTAMKGTYKRGPCLDFDDVATQIPTNFAPLINEPAFSMQEASFVFWYDADNLEWAKVIASRAADIDSDDGSEYLMSWITGDAEYLKNWIGGYYEMQVDVGPLSAVLDFTPLSEELIKQLNSDFDRDSLVADLDEIGYPHTL